jgi:hypothetical protein
MGFADSIKASATKIKREVSESILAEANELFTEVVKESPVDKGVLINNWYVGSGGTYSASYNPNETNKDGMSSYMQIASLRAFTGFLGRDGSVNLTNNTPYGYRAEYLGWPTPQWTGRVGPYAMIAKAFVSVVPKYKRLQ